MRGAHVLRSRRTGEIVGVFFACVAAAVAATWPLARFAATRVPLNLVDPLENVWIFSWVAHAMVHSPMHIWAGNIFFPDHHTLAYAEAMLGMAVPAAPIYWLTGNGVLTVNLALFASFGVGGLGFYLLLKELTGLAAPALVAALAFSVTPYRLSLVGHPHVLGIHLIPFVLLAMIRRSSRWTIGGLSALQVYSSFTGAVLLAIVAIAWIIWQLARSHSTSMKAIRHVVIGLALGALLSVPVLAPFVIVKHEHPEDAHPSNESLLYSASPSSYLAPFPVSTTLAEPEEFLFAHFTDRIAPWEKTLFPGFWLMIAAAAGIGMSAYAFVRRRRRPWQDVAGLFGLMGAIAFILSLGPHYGGHSSGFPLPFALMDKLVPGHLVRVPARIGELVLFAACAFGALALAAVPKRFRRIAVIVSLLALTIETVPAKLNTSVVPPISRAERAVALTYGGILMLPIGLSRIEPLQMYESTAHFHQVTNGYASFLPLGYRVLVRAVRDFPDHGSIRSLEQRGVFTVVVSTRYVDDTPWEGVVRKLRHHHDIRLIAADRFTRVYDIGHAGSG